MSDILEGPYRQECFLEYQDFIVSMSEFVKFVFDFKYRVFPITKYSTQVNKGKPSDHPPACESIFLSRVECRG